MTIEYKITFTEEELTLLIQCLHKDIMSKQDQPAVEIEPGVFSRTPQHTALLTKMVDKKNKVIK